MRQSRPWSGLALGLVLILAATPAAAQSKSAMARTMMEKSGINVLIDSFPQQIRQGMARAKSQGNLPADAEPALDQATEQAFAPERLRQELHSRIVEQVDKERLARIIAFLDTELGGEITAMENATAAGTPPGKLLQEGKKLRQQYQEDNPQRLQLMEDFISATRADESMTDFMVSLQTAVASGVAKGLRPQDAPSVEAVREQIEKRRFKIRAQVGQLQTAEFLYTYRKASNQQLSRYLEFLRTPEGQVYSRKLMSLFTDVLVARTRAFGEEVGARLQEG